MTTGIDPGTGGPEPGAKPRGRFYRLLPGAMAYPFRGLGWAVIVMGAVCFAAADFVASLSVHPGFSLPQVLLRLILTFAAAGYLAAFMLKVLASSAGGDDLPPDWPDLTSPWREFLKPLLLAEGAVVLAFGPAAALVWPEVRAAFGWPATPAGWAALTWAVLYLPMALIGASLYESFAGLNPLLVTAGVVRTSPAYVAAAAMFFLCYAASFVLQRFASAVPLVGSVVAWAVSLYFLMAEMRVLGLLYRTHARRLGWFD